MKTLVLAFMVLILGSIAVFAVSCGEKEDADQMKMDDSKSDSKADKDMKHDGMKHDEMGDNMKKNNDMKDENMKNDDMKKDDSEMIIVSTCPVMDAKANLDGKYIDYKGYRVYFCCDGCDDEFEKNPDKYIEKIKANPEKYIKQ